MNVIFIFFNLTRLFKLNNLTNIANNMIDSLNSIITAKMYISQQATLQTDSVTAIYLKTLATSIEKVKEINGCKFELNSLVMSSESTNQVVLQRVREENLHF